MMRRAFSISTVFCGAAACVAVGLATLLFSGCDEIDQIADNAAKRPPVQSLMPPQIDTDPEARPHTYPKQQPTNTQPANPPAANEAQNSAAATTQPNAAASQPANAQPSDQPAQTPAPQAAQPAAPAQPSGQTEMMTLDGNTSLQGQGYGGGLITEPVHQFFSMRNLIMWDQIKHDMDIWQAIHNRWPKNAQEFQKEILEPARIELPDLPPGNRYVYNPKTGELLVARKSQ
jgi:hypothetical protein